MVGFKKILLSNVRHHKQTKQVIQMATLPRQYLFIVFLSFCCLLQSIYLNETHNKKELKNWNCTLDVNTINLNTLLFKLSKISRVSFQRTSKIISNATKMEKNQLNSVCKNGEWRWKKMNVSFECNITSSAKYI